MTPAAPPPPEPVSHQPGPGQQLTKFACLNCFRVFKRAVADLGKRNWPRPVEVRRCPACGGDAYLMSSDFRAPPRTDRKAWEVVAFLVRNGFPYFRLFERVSPGDVDIPGLDDPRIQWVELKVGPYPDTLAEAQEFVDRYRRLAQPIVRD